MNKAEAIQALKEGKKLSHRLFLPGQFIGEEHGVYIDEKGKRLNISLFWRWRRTLWWDVDWFEYKQQNANA